MGKGEIFTTQFRLSTTLKKKPFDTIVGKGENAGNQQFLLFPRYFPPREELSLQQYLLCCVQMLLI